MSSVMLRPPLTTETSETLEVFEKTEELQMGDADWIVSTSKVRRLFQEAANRDVRIPMSPKCGKEICDVPECWMFQDINVAKSGHTMATWHFSAFLFACVSRVSTKEITVHAVQTQQGFSHKVREVSSYLPSSSRGMATSTLSRLEIQVEQICEKP
jgi:hypothetical protein